MSLPIVGFHIQAGVNPHIGAILIRILGIG